MNLQVEFDKTIDLLKSNSQEFPQTDLLFESIHHSTVTFYSLMDKEISGTLKENILGIAEIEAELEQNKSNDPYVFGYDSFLQQLKKTKHKHICISTFMTFNASFIVYTDFNKKELIGVLVSKDTLQEARNRNESLKNLIKNAGMGENVQIDDTKIKYIFVDGQFQQS